MEQHQVNFWFKWIMPSLWIKLICDFQSYTQYTYNFVANNAITEVKLGFRDDPSYLALDNVSVTASNLTFVPEPHACVLLASFIVMGSRVPGQKQAQQVPVGSVTELGRAL